MTENDNTFQERAFKEYSDILQIVREEPNYYNNHPDSTIAIAMEVVIQVGNLWDDGVRELTPTIRTDLKNALTTLQKYQNKNQRINNLIRAGNHYLNTMITPTNTNQ